MNVIATPLAGVVVLEPKKFGDDRGFFSETWSRRTLETHGLDVDFVQDNHSLSREVGVVRGLHYQINPAAQLKLVRVTAGAILDVAVDIRRDSPTFGRHVAVELSAENWRQLYIPAGFAHGFVTLVPNTEVLYKVTAFYSPEHDRGIRWNDPKLGINWGEFEEDEAILSPKDAKLPMWSEVTDWF
jgi:dTDP-4-dehydrorhamnose 3,5-epimerase